MYGHTCAVNCVSILPNKLFAFSGTHDGRVLVWDLSSGLVVSQFEHHAPVTVITCAHDSRQVGVGLVDGSCVFWDANSRKKQSSSKHHSSEVSAIEFFGAGCVLTASLDGSIRVQGASPKPYVVHAKGGSVLCVAVCDDEGFFLTGSRNGTIEKFEIKTGKSIFAVDHCAGAPVYALRVTPDHDTFFSATETAIIHQHNSKSGDVSQKYEGFNEFFISVEFSQDASFAIASVPDGALAKIDLSTGEVIASFWGESFVECVSISEDGQLSVTG
jgi:WD40 repeat protein